MSAVDYLKMPPQPPSIQSPPITQPPAQLSTNDQIKMFSMKHKIMKNFVDMFQINNIAVSPYRNAMTLQFICLLIEKYKNDSDQHLLVRLHGFMESAFRTTTVTIGAMDECVYLLSNPRIVEAIYMFTQ
jgi:hypothetical protein